MKKLFIGDPLFYQKILTFIYYTNKTIEDPCERWLFTSLSCALHIIYFLYY